MGAIDRSAVIDYLRLSDTVVVVNYNRKRFLDDFAQSLQELCHTITSLIQSLGTLETGTRSQSRLLLTRVL